MCKHRLPHQHGTETEKEWLHREKCLKLFCESGAKEEEVLFIIVSLGKVKTLRTKHCCLGVVTVGEKVLYPSGQILKAAGNDGGEISLIQVSERR